MSAYLKELYIIGGNECLSEGGWEEGEGGQEGKTQQHPRQRPANRDREV